MKTLDSSTFSADPPESPPASRVKFGPTGIPKELQAIPRWMPWKWLWKDGKWKKPPCNVDGIPVDCHKPANWMTFAEAVEAVFAKPDTFAGIGFCFAPDAEGNLSGYAAWDVDGCRDPLAGKLASWAQQIEIDLDSYAEVSPSGTGIRIVCRATGLPPGKRKTSPPLERHWSCPPGGIGPSHVKYLPPQAMPNANGKEPAIEVFVSSGYVTLTGCTLTSGPHPLPIHERSEKCRRLHAALWPSEKRPPTAPSARPQGQGNAGAANMSDADLLSKAMTADRYGALFLALWEGRWQGLRSADGRNRFPSQSEADYELCKQLAYWTGSDAARMDTLFRRSRLMRHDKWDRKWGDSTYGEQTIEQAIKDNDGKHYDPTYRGAKSARDRGTIDTGGIGGGAGSMSRQQQAQEQTEPQETQQMENEEPQRATGTDGGIVYVHGAGPEPEPTPGTNGAGPKPESENQPPAAFHLTDDGNANRLVARHGENLLYCQDVGWLEWDGRVWKRGAESQAYTRATETVVAIYRDLPNITDPDRRQALARHAARSESAMRLRAMLELARHKPALRVTAEQLDANPWVLTCANGTLEFDPRTGEWHRRDHRQADFCTRMTRAPYDPSATAPTWLKFLARVVPDPEVRGYLQRAAGYSLAGDTREKCLFILHGPTNSGKTTFLELLGWLLGDYACATPAELLLVKRDGGIPNDLARLKGLRFVWTSETEDGRRLATALVKAMTGRDTLTARFLHKEWFDFTSQFKLWFATNHPPVVRDTGDAAWNRLKLVPFPITVPDEEQEKDLPEQLRAEAAGILNWMLEGFRQWRQGGMQEPVAVRAATTAYREAMDLLGQFLEERCALDPQASVPIMDLHQSYVRWSRMHSEPALSLRRFAQTLVERGFEKRGEKPTLYLGLRLLYLDDVKLVAE